MATCAAAVTLVCLQSGPLYGAATLKLACQLAAALGAAAMAP